MINLQFNPTRVTDTALRRAVFAAVDRSQLAKVKFGQINWEEPLTGSLIAMPFQKGWQDAVPTNPGPRLRQRSWKQQATQEWRLPRQGTVRLQASPSPTSVPDATSLAQVPEPRAAAQGSRY